MKDFWTKFFEALFDKPDCPDCTWLITCEPCGERMADVDDDLDEKGL